MNFKDTSKTSSDQFKNFESFCQKIGYQFKDTNLLKEALTHPSAAKRHHERHYERLEFLGDRVLGLIMSDLLYHFFHTDLEGDLAKRIAFLVSKESLIKVARHLELDQYMAIGKSVRAYDEARRLSLLADSCEAIIAALYLDGGLEAARRFITFYWQPLLDNMHIIPKDAKSSLQEWAQSHHYAPPIYSVVGQEGPDHAPFFTIEVHVQGLSPQLGRASSKRQAEQIAASLALQEIKHVKYK